METLLVRQRRWPVARWRELFLAHPLLLPFAVRLAWGHYDGATGRLVGTFRALGDRSLTTTADEGYVLPETGDGLVGMLHPLELAAHDLEAWKTHMADYEIEPPFPQLDRPIVHPGPGQDGVRTIKQISGDSINAMTFKGRAERFGWTRGSVQDGGCIASYCKCFPTAGVDVFLAVDGMYMGIDMYSDVRLGDVYFVRGGSVKTGSYSYDEVSDERDERVIPVGQVPPIVYSEAMGDLKKIAGSKDAAAPAEAE